MGGRKFSVSCYVLQFSTVGLFYRSLEARLYFPAPYGLWLLATEVWFAQLLLEENIQEAVDSAALPQTVPNDPVLV